MHNLKIIDNSENLKGPDPCTLREKETYVVIVETV